MENRDICQAIKNRRSIRAFLDKDVPDEIIVNAVKIAQYTASSANMQPWKITVVKGTKKQELANKLLSAFDQEHKDIADMDAYLDKWFDPFKKRRYQIGMQLYEALDIQKADIPRRKHQMRENFHGFGAPVFAFIHMNEEMKLGSYFDCGGFMQSLMLALREYGLESCPQASVVGYPSIIKPFIELPDSEKLLVALAIGYGDYDHPINGYRTPRSDLDEFFKIIK